MSPSEGALALRQASAACDEEAVSVAAWSGALGVAANAARGLGLSGIGSLSGCASLERTCVSTEQLTRKP